MSFSDKLDKNLESKYEKRLCDILQVPLEFIPKIKKALFKENINLEKFLELWEFCNEIDEKTYIQLYKYIIHTTSRDINMSCIITWKLFDHIVENQHYLKITSPKYHKIDEDYQLSTNLYQNKNNHNILADFFSLYKYSIDIDFYDKIYKWRDLDLYKYFADELIIQIPTKKSPFFFKKPYFRYILRKLKNYSKLIGKLILYYYKILDKMYKPGGVGYFKSEHNWRKNIFI